MKALPFAISFAALVLGAAAVWLSLAGRDAGPDLTGLEARIAELERQLGARAPRSRPRSGASRAAPDIPARAAPAIPPRAAPDTPDRAAPSMRTQPGPSVSGESAHAFLEGWVRSFHENGEGTEFFRLGVEAFAPELVSDLGAYLADARQPAGLRLAIAKMLGAARFKDDSRAVDALMNALRGAPSRDLAEQALRGVVQSGDVRRATELEGLSDRVEDAVSRGHVYRAIAALAGEQTNATLLRLISRERDTVAQRAIVESVNAQDEDSALEILRRASRGDAYYLRNRAAEKLGLFRSDAARQFLAEWAARESHQAVKARLNSAAAAQSSLPKYDAMRAAGPADVPNPAKDHQNAWCPKEQNGGEEWLELAYDGAIEATHVRVHQVYTWGGVVRVDVMDDRGRWHTAWEGGEVLEEQSVAQIPLAGVAGGVTRVRVVIDTSTTNGWYEIDAVELVGRGDRAWASSATASSTWGQ